MRVRNGETVSLNVCTRSCACQHLVPPSQPVPEGECRGSDHGVAVRVGVRLVVPIRACVALGRGRVVGHDDAVEVRDKGH